MRRSRRWFLRSMTGLAALAACPFPAAARPETYLLRGTVIPGDGALPLTDHAVIISRGRIDAVVPVFQAPALPDLAPPNTYILPGIINGHVHTVHSPVDRLDLFLRHGVTAIGDVGCPLSATSQLVNNPPGQTATAAFTGPVITAPGGYPMPVHGREYGYPVKNAEEGKDAVKRMADLGATMIKISFEPGSGRTPLPMLAPRTAAAICDQARSTGLIVRCHVQDLSGLKPALDAGVHGIEHIPLGKVLDSQGEPTPAYLEQIRRMVRDKIIWTPTLTVAARTPWQGSATLRPVMRFATMGGIVALGNDYPYRHARSGMVLDELGLLREAGLGAMQVLTAATSGAAMACGFRQRGIIAKGFAADILVFRENPLTDLSILGRPARIIKDGQIVLGN
jgi:imidazolonepropionase-like amidohydrolase